jgi:DNA-directed RNA polymerase subunit RPC12/RpoP
MMLKKKYYTGVQIHEAIDGVVGDYKKAIEIYRRLAKMETDEVQPVKHGKWIELSEAEYKCSACGSWYGGEYGDEVPTEYAFCPRCGAVMERSEE